MEKKSLILLYLFLFLVMNHTRAEGGDVFSDGSRSPLPWEYSRLMREEMGDDFASSWVKKALENVGDEKENPQKTWKRYLEIQARAPEEFIEQEAGHGETARLVVWKKMKEMLKSDNFIKNSLSIATSEAELKRLYKEATDDFKLTPYEAFKFSWVAAPYLPTRMAGYLYEKIGDFLLEQGDPLRAYTTYQNILNYSTYRMIRKDFKERVAEKLKALRDRYGDILNKVEKVSAREGISLSDGTRYRLVVENLKTGEPDLFLEISFKEFQENTRVIRKRIYDFDLPYLNSKKIGPFIIRDEDKILLMPQIGGAFLVFDLNGMLLEKKPLTKEIASRYEMKSIHELLFSEDAFALIPKGTFNMGSPPDEKGRDSDEALHTVTLTKDFYLQRTEVTQFQWYIVMNESPSHFKERKYCEEDWDEDLEICPNHPVEQVSHYDAVKYVEELSRLTGQTYRLPTEAEWEYAARLSGVSEEERRKFLTPDGYLDIRESGLAKTMHGFGNSEDRLGQYAWYYKNSDNQTHSVLDPRIEPIGGLYNMHGNVLEWVSDWYDEKYPTGTVIDPKGPPPGSSRVFRGGSWYVYPQLLRSANRYYYLPDYRSDYVGVRLLRQ